MNKEEWDKQPLTDIVATYNVVRDAHTQMSRQRNPVPVTLEYLESQMDEINTYVGRRVISETNNFGFPQMTNRPGPLVRKVPKPEPGEDWEVKRGM